MVWVRSTQLTYFKLIDIESASSGQRPCPVGGGGDLTAEVNDIYHIFLEI